jgi:hypothetical protein
MVQRKHYTYRLAVTSMGEPNLTMTHQKPAKKLEVLHFRHISSPQAPSRKRGKSGGCRCPYGVIERERGHFVPRGHHQSKGIHSSQQTLASFFFSLYPLSAPWPEAGRHESMLCWCPHTWPVVGSTGTHHLTTSRWPPRTQILASGARFHALGAMAKEGKGKSSVPMSRGHGTFMGTVFFSRGQPQSNFFLS